MTKNNKLLSEKYFQNNKSDGIFYITLCLQTGHNFLTEANIKRKVESMETAAAEEHVSTDEEESSSEIASTDEEESSSEIASTDEEESSSEIASTDEEEYNNESELENEENNEKSNNGKQLENNGSDSESSVGNKLESKEYELESEDESYLENDDKREESSSENEVQRGESQLKPCNEMELVTIMDISKERKKGSSNRVLLLGGPGTGKTTISQTLSYRWGIRELWDEKYDFVFHLTCRKLKEDCKSESGVTSILKLLMKHHPPNKKYHTKQEELYQHITLYGDRILVIIDGLDELEGWKEVVRKLNQEDKEEGRGKPTIRTKHPVPELIYNLAFGRIEEKVEVLLTSRPNESIKPSHFQKSLYALGFNEDAIDECSFALCHMKEEKHTQLMKLIKDKRPSLYYLCVVPLNCVLLWSHLLEDRDSITSLTDLSLNIVKACMESRKDGQSDDSTPDTIKYQKNLLQSMAKLAFKCFISKDLIFTNKLLIEYNIDVNDSSVNNLMEIHGSDASELDNIQASFIHLSIQEFLAAVHVCITWEEDDVMTVATVDPGSRRLDNVQLYTAGLLGDTNNGHKFLQALDERDGDKEQLYKEQANEYVTSMISSGEELSSLTKLQMIRCAHEGRMTEMVEEVAKAVLEVQDRDPYTVETIDEVNMLDLSETDGGLLPHHLVSIGYFVQESGQVGGLK